MNVLMIILSVCLFVGASSFVLCSVLCAIAPDFVNRHDIKDWVLKIGGILVLVGLTGIFIH